MLTCTILPHFLPAAIAAALEAVAAVGQPAAPAPPWPLSSVIAVSFFSEESLPNPMKPWDVSPSLALCPANFAKRANLKKGLEKDTKREKDRKKTSHQACSSCTYGWVAQWVTRGFPLFSAIFWPLSPKKEWTTDIRQVPKTDTITSALLCVILYYTTIQLSEYFSRFHS